MATTQATPEIHRERFPLMFRRLEVVRVTDLAPRYRRVTFGGEELRGFASLGADDHAKLLFPVAGQTEPVLPAQTETGWTYPAGATKPAARDFTPRRYDVGANEVDFEFVLHGAGPAATWAAQAAPGQRLGSAGPRGSRIVPPIYDFYLLAGDETALASMGRWLELIQPGATVKAFVEVNDASDEFPLATAGNLALTWLHRNGAAPGSTTLLLDAIRETALPAGEGNNFYWAAGEAGGLKLIRRHLLNERGIPQEQLHLSGHWKRNVTNWDHHEPIDDEASE